MGDVDMKTTLERAFELAASGKYATIGELHRVLAAEGLCAAAAYRAGAVRTASQADEGFQATKRQGLVDWTRAHTRPLTTMCWAAAVGLVLGF